MSRRRARAASIARGSEGFVACPLIARGSLRATPLEDAYAPPLCSRELTDVLERIAHAARAVRIFAEDLEERHGLRDVDRTMDAHEIPDARDGDAAHFRVRVH